MLSDEEKKAIEILKLRLENASLYVRGNNEVFYNALGIVLKLIEKQSKEIEELKQDNKKKSIVIIEYQDLYEKLVDKIKAKIEELIKEGNYRTTDNPNGRVHFQKEITDYQIEVLQSLLEKE